MTEFQRGTQSNIREERHKSWRATSQRAEFEALNRAYTDKFGFPFIIAVRDYDKPGILAAFRERVRNDADTEFAEACAQVERIAELRLQALL